MLNFFNWIEPVSYTHLDVYKRQEYPFLAFTFKGRIKSLIRAEEKFNGYIVEYIYDYYTKHGTLSLIHI